MAKYSKSPAKIATSTLVMFGVKDPDRK